MPRNIRDRRSHPTLLSASRLHLVPHLARLPVPETDKATTVTARHDPPVGRNGNVNCISTRVHPSEPFLAILSKLLPGRVHDNLIVRALVRDVFPTGMRRGFRQRKHARV